MQLRTVTFTIFTDEQGTRVRCCFCGDVLMQRTEAWTNCDGLNLLEEIKLHRCYQPNAQPPCPSVRA